MNGANKTRSSLIYKFVEYNRRFRIRFIYRVLKKTDLTMQIPVHLTPTFVSDISKLIKKFH